MFRQHESLGWKMSDVRPLFQALDRNIGKQVHILWGILFHSPNHRPNQLIALILLSYIAICNHTSVCNLIVRFL